MDKQKQIEEMHKEYVEWALGLLKTRFDLKPEFYDVHHHDNFTYECGAESLWVKIESAIKELLWLRERQIPENAVVLTQEEWAEHCEQFAKAMYQKEVNTRKETAEKFAVLRKYITEQFHHYHDIRDKVENDYKKCKEETVKTVLNNDWHRANAIMFILEKVGIEFDEICKEITEGKV